MNNEQKLATWVPICFGLSVFKNSNPSINAYINKVKHLAVLNEPIEGLIPFTILPSMHIHLRTSCVIVILSIHSSNTPEIFPAWKPTYFIDISFEINLIFIWYQISSNWWIQRTNVSVFIMIVIYRVFEAVLRFKYISILHICIVHFLDFFKLFCNKN